MEEPTEDGSEGVSERSVAEPLVLTIKPKRSLRLYLVSGVLLLGLAVSLTQPADGGGRWAPLLVAAVTLLFVYWVLTTGPRRFELHVAPNGLTTVEPDGATTEIGWSLFEKVTDGPDGIEFVMSDGQGFTVPPAEVPADRRELTDRLPRSLPYQTINAPPKARRPAMKNVVLWVLGVVLFSVIYRLTGQP